MYREVYQEKRTFERYDSKRFSVYLNEEVIENYVPETTGMDNEQEQEPFTAYAYTGTERDGGTLIECTTADRDSLINGIIRSKYSQTEENAIKTHQINLLNNPKHPKADEYAVEWKTFNSLREEAISVVDGWFN